MIAKLCSLGAVLAAIVLAPGQGSAEPAPALLELFTSQGCSSCPPADALLGEASRRPGVLALAYHVDYWDRLGWKDPFSSPASTQLQRAYDGRLQVETYTPQLVVNGVAADVGSDRAALERMLAAPHRALTPGTIQRSGGGFRYMLADRPRGDAVLVTYDPEHTTQIGRGENGGRTLVDVNAVRSRRVVALPGDLTGELEARADETGQRWALLDMAPDGTRVLAVDRR